MALFGIIATVISAWAVFLLRQTLNATREAVLEARNATDLSRKTLIIQQRPWLRVVDFKVDSPLRWRSDGTAAIKLSYSVENIGASPAERVSVRPYVDPTGFLNVFGRKGYFENIRFKTAVNEFGETINQTERIFFSFNFIINDEQLMVAYRERADAGDEKRFVAIAVTIAVGYEGVFSAERYSLVKAYTIQRHGLKLMRPTDGDTSDLVISRNYFGFGGYSR